MRFIKLFSRIPFTTLYLLSDVLFLFTYHVVRYRRTLVWKHLATAFPGKSVIERRLIEKAFYRHLCDYGVEMLKLLTIRKEELKKRMVFTNPEVITSLFSRNRSVLYLTSHQFNWEWLLATGSFAFPFPTKFVYQKMSASFFERLSMMCRTRFGALGIERDGAATEILRHKDQLQGIAIAGDQYPGHGNDKKFKATFLNQETVFFAAINQIVLLTQFDSVFFEVERIRRGYYTATAHLIGEPPYPRNSDAVMRAYIKVTEETILRHPAGWLWSHNRWKTRHLRPT